jgi:hypothetical protein
MYIIEVMPTGSESDILGIPFFGVTKEIVGILLVLTCTLFAVDILRSLLPRVLSVKSTSVPLRF